MRQVLFLALIILAIYCGYVLVIGRRVEDAQQDKAGQMLIEAPAKVEKWVSDTKMARGRADEQYGEERGVVVSVSSTGVEIEHRGERKSYRVAKGTQLDGIVPGSRVLLRLLEGEIVDIRVE